MNAYLFGWNPHKWPWETLEQDIARLRQAGHLSEDWSCASHKNAQVGDRAFLVHLGEEPRGIVGSGTISKGPFLALHPIKKKEVYRVIIDFDVLLNPALEPILSLDILRLDELRKQNWTPQSSGISIRPEYVDTLEGIWADFLASTSGVRYFNSYSPKH